MSDNTFSLLADWLVARSDAWETNQELFELTKRARSRQGSSDAGSQRALGIFPVEVVFQKHICGLTKDCSVCSALRAGRFYSAVQDSLDQLDHFRANVWVDSVSFARYSDVRLSRVSGDVKLFYCYPYQVLVHAPLSAKPFPAFEVSDSYRGSGRPVVIELPFIAGGESEARMNGVMSRLGYEFGVEEKVVGSISVRSQFSNGSSVVELSPTRGDDAFTADLFKAGTLDNLEKMRRRGELAVKSSPASGTSGCECCSAAYSAECTCSCDCGDCCRAQCECCAAVAGVDFPSGVTKQCSCACDCGVDCCSSRDGGVSVDTLSLECSCECECDCVCTCGCEHVCSGECECECHETVGFCECSCVGGCVPGCECMYWKHGGGYPPCELGVFPFSEAFFASWEADVPEIPAEEEHGDAVEVEGEGAVEQSPTTDSSPSSTGGFSNKLRRLWFGSGSDRTFVP